MESSSSSKRAKAPANIAQVAHCLVDGCSADLSLCRDYHRRHKVCEAHSKTPKVTIGGREQRFCQQCSRFHSLIEFDEGKRSCRKRLDGHNRRRRKPQARSSGVDLCSQVSFSAPQMLGYPWPGVVVKNENEIGALQQQQQQLSYVETASAAAHLHQQQHHHQHHHHHHQLELELLQGGSCSSPFVDANGGLSHSKMGECECDGALSLLSSPTTMDYHQTKLDVSSTLHFPHDGSSHQTLSFMWE